MQGGRLRPCIAALAAASLVLWSGQALAGSEPDPDTGDNNLGTAGGLRYSVDSEALNLDNHGYARAVAGCGPDDWHVVGGGEKISGPSAKHRMPSSTTPYDWYDGDAVPEDGFSASGYGESEGKLKSFAICRAEPVPDYPGGTVPDSPGSVRSFQQDCDPGDKVLGGGGLIGTSESFQSKSFPVDGADSNDKADDAWAIRVYDTVGGIGGMTLRAICDDADPAYRDETDKAAKHDSAGATANCPAGTHVAGGGAAMNGPGEKVHLAGSYPIDDGDSGSHPDDGWKASAFNGTSDQHKLTAYAICLG